MIEFDVDMGYLLEEDELDCVVLNDENGEHGPMTFWPVGGECENESKDGFKCSKCGDAWLGGFNLGPIAFKRCPSCGAKVRKAAKR